MQSLAETIVDKLLDEYYYPGMEPEDSMDAIQCPQCGGEGQRLGSLGNVEHFRCRQCGWDFSSDSHETPPPKANIMPGGSPGPVGDTSTIGFGAGGA